MHRRSVEATKTALTCRLVLCDSSHSDSQPSRRRGAIVGAAEWMLLETFSPGDNPALAEELARLVLAGVKTATCWWVGDGQQTYVGKKMVMLDGSGKPAAVLETLELNTRRFDEVDDAFAFDEGEGDRTLNIGERLTGVISAARASSRQT